MIDRTNINSVFGAKAVDPDGNKVGTVKQVYVDGDSGQPAFATVATGLFGTSESFVPLHDADFDGEELRLGYDKDTIKDAPRVDPDGALSPDEQTTLYDYYSLGTTTNQATTGGGIAETGAGYTTTEGRRADDDAMTRSEERLSVDKEQVPTGRARLRKHVVTEQQTVTVPVSHEEVHLEREPITDANVGDATSGPDLTESEHEITLHAERPVVDKETVPVERVRLDKDTVTDQQTVTENIAHEEIDLDDDTGRDENP